MGSGQGGGSGAVAENGKPAGADPGAAGQQFCGPEQLARAVHPHHPGAVKGSAKCEFGLGLGAAGFEYYDRFHPGGAAQTAHETTGLADVVYIEQDRLGVGVQRQVVEQVAEVQIRRPGQRYHRREAHLMRFGPVQDGTAQGVRL